MAVQRPVAERWQHMTGCHITEGYGLSEASPVACANALDATEFTGNNQPSDAIDRRGHPRR